MSDENANLSIDFLVGFAIFIIAFVWVVSMIPGLLIGLQAYTIDYDAVAYRTGVILLEDPGYPDSNHLSPTQTHGWEYNEKINVTRFGLAISKDTPNILSRDKVNRFFTNSSSGGILGGFARQDYLNKTIFGDFPYRFNFTLLDTDQNRTQSAGDVRPLDSPYGYSRRLVMIKDGTSSATFNESVYNNPPAGVRYNNSPEQNVSTHTFSIILNTNRLVSDQFIDPAYQINPLREQVVINLTDLDKTNTTRPVLIKLANVTIRRDGDTTSYLPIDSLYIDGSSTPISQPILSAMKYNNPLDVTSRVMLNFSPTFFSTYMMDPQGSNIYINLTFNLKNVTPPYQAWAENSTFLNNTPEIPFEYNYTQTNIVTPPLHPAVVEVAIW
jgi:hypothetical protein